MGEKREGGGRGVDGDDGRREERGAKGSLPIYLSLCGKAKHAKRWVGSPTFSNFYFENSSPIILSTYFLESHLTFAQTIESYYKMHNDYKIVHGPFFGLPRLFGVGLSVSLPLSHSIRCICMYVL